MTPASNTDISGVLFDLDGTLVDTAPDFIHCVNLLRIEHDLPPLEESEIRKVVSDGARAMIKLAINMDADHVDFPRTRQHFLDLYEQKIADHSALFEGFEALLNDLSNASIPWGVVTNKPRHYAVLLLEKLGWLNKMQTLVCPDDVTHAKPDPEPMLLACSQLNLDPRRCLYVGDHERDIQAGKNANMPTVAAGYGYVHHPDEAYEWQADHTFSSALKLCDWLKTTLIKAT